MSAKYLTPKCPLCNKESEIELTNNELLALDTWLGGQLLQKAFPDWTDDKRELLKTGYHSECWDKDMREVNE